MARWTAVAGGTKGWARRPAAPARPRASPAVARAARWLWSGAPVVLVGALRPVALACALLPRRYAGSPLTTLGAALLAGGPALLATFILLGRPPISVPTAAGLSCFSLLAALLLVAWWREARYVASLSCRAAAPLAAAKMDPPDRCAVELAAYLAAWRWVLAGYAPLALAWPLAGALYVPEIHHWFATVPSVKPAMAGAVLLPALALKLALAAVRARERLVAWCWRHRYLLAGAVHALAALAAKPSLWHVDLPTWFVPAARLVLSGRPLEMFSVRADVMGTAAPVEHGPLTILFYTPFVALAGVAGVSDFRHYGAIFPLAGVLAIDWLLAWQVTRAIRQLAPQASEQWLFGAFVLVLFSPILWLSSIWLLHLENLLALLAIVAVRLLSQGRAAAAGAVLGSALLVKHSAALVAGPVVVLLALLGYRRQAAVAGGVAGAVMVAGLLPFALAHPEDVLFNFLGYEAVKPIYGITIWKTLHETGLEPLAIRFDSFAIGSLALAGAAALALAARRAGAGAAPAAGAEGAALPPAPAVPAAGAGEGVLPAAPASGPGKALPAAGTVPAAGGERVAVPPVPLELCWVAILLGQIAWLALATWQYPHYLLLGFVALLIWEGASSARSGGGWPVLTLLWLFVPYHLQTQLPRNISHLAGPFVVLRAAVQLLFFYGCALAVWLRCFPGGQRGAAPR